MNPWDPVYPYPGYYPYHSPAAYPGHTASPAGYPGYTVSPPRYSQLSGDLWNHPLYQMQMPQGPYQMYPSASSASQNAPASKSGSQLLLQSFKNKDGTFDIGKAVDTAGMMVNTVSQLSNVVSGIVKTFKA
ncbi:YppG family protein [Bacillus sp. B190/17]|uniref:YppG family protein n=1 Tax=Bacillus lumedeiriae TaxID=3058829 RepID=A0ABW8I3X9_9BACI